MTGNEQLERWVVGESVHNDESGECCPDFSCCQPRLLASKEERKAFAEADRRGDEKSKLTMLGGFLGAAISLAADLREAKGEKHPKVYIADGIEHSKA